ncbi:hypothetical protein SDC9_114490 [bioreactor metagenome]|uniref:DJ-1/PfpI domain-containing protein n=1 Tax=bioreactor metagenome TaxID=1076179 RepID=A0A645BQP9_9ZZZZ
MIYVFMANGFEEVEALATVDFLRRCELDVTSVGIGSRQVTGSHAITVVCDIMDSELSLNHPIETIVLPGGMPGTINLEKSPVVQRLIDYCIDNQILICAICAAPSILGHKNILQGVKATCFPGFENELFGANLSNDYVCHDSNIITAKGVGYVFDFAQVIASQFVPPEKAAEIRRSLQCR